MKVRLHDGAFHSVDSSENAFKVAGSMAFKSAVEKAHPVLLEPYVRVEVLTPSSWSATSWATSPAAAGDLGRAAR